MYSDPIFKQGCALFDLAWKISKTFHSKYEGEGAWNIGMVLFADANAAASFPMHLVNG